MNRCILLLFFFTKSLFVFPLFAKETETFKKELERNEVREKIKLASQTLDYQSLGKFLKNHVQNKLDLKKIKEIALEVNEKKLLQAAKFTLQLSQLLELEDKKMVLDFGKFLEIALFIEAKLSCLVEEKKYFLTKEMTDLSQNIEYDPETKFSFILLDGIKGAFIGEGAAKTVKMAILYDVKNPEIVARAEQKRNMEKEVTFMKELNGIEGLIKTRAYTTHVRSGERFFTLYADRYNLGSLVTAWKRGFQFSLDEKIDIAKGIMTGLSQLHKKNIIHRDVRAHNCFLHLTHLDDGSRKFNAVLADYGCAIRFKDAFQIPPQAVRTYWPPDALITARLKGNDYFRTEIFAAGCVLYELFYDRIPPWRKPIYYHNKVQTVQEKQYFLDWKISNTLRTKSRLLEKKRASKEISQKEYDFARLILGMLNLTPQKRKSAEEIKTKLCEISASK